MQVFQGTSAADLTGVAAIIALITDKDASAKRLSELTAAAKEAEQKEASAKAAADVADKTHKEADALMLAAEQQASVNADMEKRLEAKAANLSEQEATQQAAHADRARFIEKRAADLNAKEAALEQREQAVVATEKRLQDLTAQAQAAKDDMDKRLAKIKEATAA